MALQQIDGNTGSGEIGWVSCDANYVVRRHSWTGIAVYLMRSLVVVLALLLAQASWAGDFEDGEAAFARKDYATAFTKFRSAAQRGSAEAQFVLGIMYSEGKGVAQNYMEALAWYKLAAQQGDVRAQINLGSMYKNGQGVTQDHTEAVRWYISAATVGDPTAQSNLGSMYAEGKGVAQDYTAAARWYQLAAQQGNAQAQTNLGLMYFRGQGVVRDVQQALFWLKLAAAQGNPRASKTLGAMYANGLGVEKDDKEAQRWNQLAEQYDIRAASERVWDELKKTNPEMAAAAQSPNANNQRSTTRKTINTLNVDTKRTNVEEVDKLKSLLITEISDRVIEEAFAADQNWRATGQINDQKVIFDQGVNYTRIKTIVDRLLNSVNIDSSKWLVRVIDTEEKTENAFVTGGQIVYVYSGLIENAKSDDELAFVLGHEVGHSLLKHNKERIDNPLASIAGSIARLAAVISKNEQTKEKLEFVGDAITTYYSRDHEREADAFGAYIANKAGYRYSEGENFFVRVQKRAQAIESQNEAQIAQATQQVNSQLENCEQLKQQYNSNIFYRTRENAAIVNRTCQLATQNAQQVRGIQKQQLKNVFIKTHPVDDERISNLRLVQAYMSCNIGDQYLEKIGVGSFVLRALDFKQQCR